MIGAGGENTSGENLMAYMRQNFGLNGNSQPHQQFQQSHNNSIRDVKPALIAVLENRKVVATGATVLLSSNWSGIDPRGLMIKTPEEVFDFLESLTMELGMYGDMYPSRKALFKMIIDAYCRALENTHHRETHYASGET